MESNVKINSKLNKEKTTYGCLTHSFIRKHRAPVFVSIVGPKKSGKSEICSKMIKFFTKEENNSVGLYTFEYKKKSFTLFESSNNLPEVLDAIKVSDIILLVVNLENGLEKDTLEAISMINHTGIVKIMVVFTNNSYKISKSKKMMIMKRLLQEFSFKFKFYDFNNDDISRICKCIDTMKITSTTWKSTHPYIVVDDSKDGYLYGYLRGQSINSNSNLFAHIPGHGDIVISTVEKTEDEKMKKSRKPYYTDKIVCAEEKTAMSNEISEDMMCEEDDLEDMDRLRKKAQERFKKKAVTEEELKDKFLENYSDESSEKDSEDAPLIEVCDGTIMVGDYCKMKVNLNYNKERLMIIGGYLVGEKNLTMLQGKVIKNKWQGKDLKTNAPYFISMGWARFQTIPVFAKDEKAIKYVRGSIGSDYSEIVFYGPFVVAGTSFMIFDTQSDYKILGNGQILNSDGGIRVKKKLKLIGYPKKIMGNNVIIQSMFSSAEEVNKFINAKLNCVSGLRGILKRPIGRCGDFRASFEGSMLFSDIIFIKCYLPFEPIKYCKHMQAKETYVNTLADIRKEKGLPLYESDQDTDNSSSEEKNTSQNKNNIRPGKASETSRIKRLEHTIALYSNDFVIPKESIDLPTPPNELKNKHEFELLEQRRKIKEAQEKTNRFIRKTERERRRNAEKAEIEKRRKTNAIECKRSKEKGGKIKKKFKKQRK